VPSDERIFVNDPPSYYVISQRPSLVIPTDGPETVARAAEDWDTNWLLLEGGYGETYETMYEEEEADAGWTPVATFEDPLGEKAVLFQFEGLD
jgi:hypothetical protein